MFSANAGKCGENADQNNSEYGHFLRRKVLVNIVPKLKISIDKVMILISSPLTTKLKALSINFGIIQASTIMIKNKKK